MAFREVSVYEIREVLRLWLLGYGIRTIDRLTGADRKTIRRYVDAATLAGLVREAGEETITDHLIGQVVDAVRPARRGGHGKNWNLLAQHREFLEERVKADLTLVKVQDLFTRRTGVVVPYATLRRYCISEFGWRKNRNSTVPLADCEPGAELQADFGKMGLIPDPTTGRRRVAKALIFTSVFSRHMFIFLTFHETLASVIEGFEAAWSFFGGVFKVAIPDNVKAIVSRADDLNPRLNDGFLEYMQSRGFVVDLARIRHPKDKARVERSVGYVRKSFFQGEDFRDLADAQVRAELWCLKNAGLRTHRRTQRRPFEMFEAEEKQFLLPAPEEIYDLPIYADAKVHPDHHIEVGKAIYSVPGEILGEYVKVRADRNLVRISYKGKVIKTHPRQPPGGRSTDEADLPAEKTAYAMRDINRLLRSASVHGESVGQFAAALLNDPLPWTKMRKVYRLLGLVRRYGAERVNQACEQALEFESLDVNLVGRMLERARENTKPALPRLPDNVVQMQLRFARPAEDFHVKRGGEDG